jgi:ribosomal protein S9
MAGILLDFTYLYGTLLTYSIFKKSEKGVILMKKLISITIIVILLVVAAYAVRSYMAKQQYAIKINDFTMTQQEFEDYFKEVNIYGEGKEARQQVLDNLISKKLVLQEAENRELYKSKEFLKRLQDYYEQLLFNEIVDIKAQEVGSKVRVSDREVRARYSIMKKEGLIDEPLEDCYSRVKWQVFRQKQTERFSDWIEELEKNADIQIDKEKILK